MKTGLSQTSAQRGLQLDTQAQPQQTDTSTSNSAAAEYEYRLLQPQDIEDHWQHIEPLLETVVDRMWDHNMQTLQAALVDPNVRMYLVAVVNGGAIKGVVGVELLEGANGVRAINFSFFSGPGWRKWMPDGMPKVLNLAREHGCEIAVGTFRDGIKRLFPNWNWTHRVGIFEL